MSKNAQQEIAAPEAASQAAEVDTAELQKQDTRKGNGKDRERFFSSRRITKFAVFVALALIMKLIGKALTIMPTFTVTFIYLPWLISGAVLGPVGGMIVGALSDVLGNLVFGSPFIPLTFVSNTIYALPIALIYKFAPVRNDYVKCVAGAVISLLACTLGIGSLALYRYYGYVESMGFAQYLLLFRMPQVGVFAVNVVVLCALVRPLGRVGLFPASTAAAPHKGRIFAVTSAVFTAMLVAAVVAITLTHEGASATELVPVYAAVCCIYAALMLMAGLQLADKHNRVAGITLPALAVLALIAGLVTFIAVPGSGDDIAMQYFIPVAALLVLALIAAAVIYRLKNSRR